MPKIKKQIIGNDDQVLDTEYMSGYLNHPVRVIQQFSDCLPLAYPTITRTGFEGLTGNEDVIPFDDSKTIVFNSAHATAWIEFFGNPKDGSTIKLFDPSGSIELDSVIAQPGMIQDDLSVSTPDQLVNQAVYEIEISQVDFPSLVTTNSDIVNYPSNDSPVFQGSWTGVKHIVSPDLFNETNYTIKLEISNLEDGSGLSASPPTIDNEDPESFESGTFTVSISGPSLTSAWPLELKMPEDGEERAITDHELTDNPSNDADLLKYYEGLTITWPNPRNITAVTDVSTGGAQFSISWGYDGTFPYWNYRLPYPDAFRWRKSSQENLQWDDWQPDSYGTAIGTGNIKKNVIAKNLSKNELPSGVFYSEPIDINTIFSNSINRPEKVSFNVYARGDLTAADANEYYRVWWTLETDESAREDGTNDSWEQIGQIDSLKEEQTDKWLGLSAYAPFADGAVIDENLLQYIEKDGSGNPVTYTMPNRPHIVSPSPGYDISVNDTDGYRGQFNISPNENVDKIWFKIEVGENVSWGKCEVKIQASFTGNFLGIDGIDNNDASGNNLLLSWGNFANHGLGDKWVINIEDSTSQTFEFNRGVITNPNNTEIKLDKKVKSKNRLNALFAKAVNSSGLQIQATFDKEKIYLTQTIPGSIGNISIFADANSKCYISNSKNFVLGADGAVTGSFSGGENYLVSYPTTLPVPAISTNTDGQTYWSNKDLNIVEGYESYKVISSNQINIPFSLQGDRLYTDQNSGLTIAVYYTDDDWRDLRIAGIIPQDHFIVPSFRPAQIQVVTTLPDLSSPDYDEGDYVCVYTTALENDNKPYSDYIYRLSMDRSTSPHSLDWMLESQYIQKSIFPDGVWAPTSDNIAWDEEAWRQNFGFIYEVTHDSPWLHNQIVSPNIFSSDNSLGLENVGLVSIGSTKKGVSDYGTSYKEKNDAVKISPFYDTSITHEDEEFYTVGVPGEKFEGFSSSLDSKTKISIDMPVIPFDVPGDSETTIGFDAPALDGNGNKNRFNSMVYYNFVRHKWETVGNDNPGFISVPEDSSELKEFFENACIGFSRGVELIQGVPEIASMPISNFGFPMHPKFAANDEQTLDMSQYIDKPFVLEKFVLEFEAQWDEGKDYTKRTVMYDVGADGKITRSDESGAYNNKAAINNFFILNQRDWVGEYDYSSIGEPIKYWYPPDYEISIEQGNPDINKNRYMWSGSNYRYVGGSSLVSLFRFLPDPLATTHDADKLQVVINEQTKNESLPANKRDFDINIYPDANWPKINRESSPWEFPVGASTEAYESSAAFTGEGSSGVLQITLGNILGNDSPYITSPENVNRMFADSVNVPDPYNPPYGLPPIYVSPSAWNANAGNGNITSTHAFVAPSSYPGNWPWIYAISNQGDDDETYDPSSNQGRFDARVIGTTKFASNAANSVYTFRYLYAQATTAGWDIDSGINPYPDPSFNEAPDPGMEFVEGYRSEALRFQIAKCPTDKPDDWSSDEWAALQNLAYSALATGDVNDWFAKADAIDKLEWIDINVHEPDYQKQGLWQEASVTIDQNIIFGEDHNSGYFIRFIQYGSSGWPDTWYFGDISVDVNPSFTKSLWFKPSAAQTNQNLISVVNPDAVPNKFWVMIAKDGTLRLLVDSGSNRVYSKIISQKIVTDGNWHHVTVTFNGNGSNFNMWLDGEHIGQHTLEQGKNKDGDLLWVDSFSTGDPEPVTVDESRRTISQLATAGIYPPADSEYANEAGDWINSSSSIVYTFTGEESIEIEGVRIFLTLDEYMKRLSYKPHLPWYFNIDDYVIIGADADASDPPGPGQFKYDNHYTGEIADIAVWNVPLDGISVKAIYELRSGYYKVSSGSSIELSGSIPTRFKDPNVEDENDYYSTSLTPVTQYDTSGELLSRYLFNVPKLKIDVEGKYTKEPSVIGIPAYYEDSPYTISTIHEAEGIISGNKKYCIDLRANSYLKLGRLGEYIPFDSSSTQEDQDFSFFTWIKMPEIKENNPVIFSINDSAGKNRLIFYVDTADRIYVKEGPNAEKPSGMRLGIFVKATPLDNADLTSIANTAWNNVNSSYGDIDVGISSTYRVFTNSIRQGKKWEVDPLVSEVDNDLWHHVGFTHTVINGRSSFEIYFDGDKQNVHTETAWKVTGPSNDKYMLTFHDGAASELAGYHPDLWTDDGGANYGGWLSPDPYDSGGNRRVYKETNSVSNGSRFHKPLTELLQADDRVSVGQEYDVSYRRFFSTSRTGLRSYSAKRYRVASQKINARITDITLWKGAVSSAYVDRLYKAAQGASNTKKHYASTKGTARDLITFGQWCIHASTNETSDNINDILDAGLSRELNTPATRFYGGEYIEHDGDPSTPISNSGKYKMEGTVKRPVKHSGGLSYRIGKGTGSSSIRSIFRTEHNGTRTGQKNDLVSPRGIFNTTPGSKVIGSYYDFGSERKGLDKNEISVYESYEQTSPYVLQPSDKLVFGWQCALPFDFSRVNDKDTGPTLTMLESVSSKIVLYGSFISDNKEKHDPLNQNLTSDAVHEALQFESPVFDRFDLEDIGYTAGTYVDDVVLGKMMKADSLASTIGTDRYGSFYERLNRQRAGSVAEHTQGADGSCLKGVRLVDEKERYFDTVVASPADYHQFNGNGILEWSSPLFDEGKTIRSICIGEPKPSDMKIVQAEITNIACQDEGWYEPLPQGVVKLSFHRLWTADDRYGTTSLRYFDEYHNTDTNTTELPDLSYGDSETQTFEKVGWDISQTSVEGMFDIDGDGKFQYAGLEGADTGQGYFYTTYGSNAGVNYMFTSSKRSLDDIEISNLRDAYFTLYDANGDAHYIWLQWDDAQSVPSAISSSSNVYAVDMSGWNTGTNGWESIDPMLTTVSANTPVLPNRRLHRLISEENTGLGWHDEDEAAGAFGQMRKVFEAHDTLNLDWLDVWPQIFNPYPSDSRFMPAGVLADKIVSTIENNLGSLFEVLDVEGDGSHDSGDDNDNIHNVYIRTISGGLRAKIPSSDEELAGGGIPGVHYGSPEISSAYVSNNSYAYNTTMVVPNNPIVEIAYLASDLEDDTLLKDSEWGTVHKVYSTAEETATSLGLTLDVPGVQQYVNNLTPNNPSQFRHQYPVIEEKNGFERVIGYTLDGCFFQIHDANDNAYNIWYKLNDGLSEVPPAPTTPGVLITVETVTPGSPSSDVAKATADAISEQYPQSFMTSYEQGKSFFKIENVMDGETKDADSTIMGLPLTTGFYLVDDLGAEYDNESYRWAFNWGGPGFFSFSKIFTSTESYAEGRTPETEEVFWHGDPIQEGNNSYHKNTNNMIDSYWLGSYPFEPRYSSLFRGKFFKTDRDWLVTNWDHETGEFSETNTTSNRFFTVILTGSNIENKVIDPTLDSEPGYNVLPLLGTGDTDIISSYILGQERNIGVQLLKFYFGSGNTWQKNPELERVYLYADGYDWPSYVPRIRGWKYGLISALPANSTAVYRYDSYGQFRDMLEQRADARFYKTLTRGRFKGRGYPSSSPVRVRFVDEDGRLTTPEKTWSQNLSRFCTSSLPFFDDGLPRNREEIDPSQLNTSLGIIED